MILIITIDATSLDTDTVSRMMDCQGSAQDGKSGGSV